MNRTLSNYTFPCTGGNKKLVQEVDERLGLIHATPEQVRNYFFQKHNPKEFCANNLFHLCIPYEIMDDNGAKLYLPFFQLPTLLQSRRFSQHEIEKAQKKNIFGKINKGDILVTHCTLIVDKLSPRDLEEYTHLYK